MKIFRVVYNFFRKENGVYEYFPLDLCRGDPAFSFGENGSHPHIEILKKYINLKDEEKLYKDLIYFYSNPNFLSAADIYNRNINKRKFEEIRAYAMPFPWLNDNPKLNEKKIEKGLEREARLNLFFGLAEEWWSWGGYAPLKKIKIEVRRYKKILSSFIRKGYDKSTHLLSPITGTLVISVDNKKVVVINSGQHRCIVASAINIPGVMVRIDSVVSFQNFHKWNLVENNIFSRLDIELFEERLFSSRGLDY
jgi:hypothetical protein